MKTRILLSIMFVFLVIVFISCENDIPITDVTFEKEAVALKVGETLTLDINTYPAGASTRNLRWNSSNNNIAIVNDRGEVTAIAKGTIEIIVTTNDGIEMASSLVAVIDEPNLVMEIASESAPILFSPPNSSAFVLGFNSPGITVVDWGDGTDMEIFINTQAGGGWITRNFANGEARTVKIYSEHIVSLHSNRMLPTSGIAGGRTVFFLTDLDVSRAPHLMVLDVDNNQLTSLDVSKNVELLNLFVRRNYLSSLDVSKNTKLVILWCQHNNLTSLNLNGAIALTDVWANLNQLANLDVSGVSSLRRLIIYANLFTANALNDLYATLPLRVAGSYGQITVGDIAVETDRSIAERRGWVAGTH
jgi:hypothetical protein